MKISQTMKRRKIDNFATWRKKAKKEGRFKSHYPPLKRNGNLAELIGVILGDGYIGKFPRTEVLRIVGNYNNQGFIKRYASLIEKIFSKKPYVAKMSTANAMTITLYQKEISGRLGIPHGSKKFLKVMVPQWIIDSRKYTIRYLRGLYEAEGSHCVHKKTCTYKLFFSNTNESLLLVVFLLVKRLGYHPHLSKNKVQVSSKDEVQKLKNLIQFRNY